MPRALTLGTLGGIVLQARISAPMAFVFLVWFLASVYLGTALPRDTALTHWSLAFLITLFLYLSAASHEMAHCLVARRRGISAQTITLSLFGASSDVAQEGQKGLDELLVSAAGPGISLVGAGGALALRFGLPDPSPPLALFLEAMLVLNVWLGGFNLLPVLPLDGGRAIRGLAWHLKGDYLWATSLTAIIGRALAALLAVASLALLLLSFDTGEAVIGVRIGSEARLLALSGLLVAWYLNNGVRGSQRQAVLQHRLAGLTVGQLMSPNPRTVPPWTTLEEITTDHFRPGQARAIAVVASDEALVGLVAYSDVAKVPAAERRSRTAGEVMTAARDLVTVSPDDGLEVAIAQMARRHLNQLPVVEHSKLVGMIDRENILRRAEGDTGRARK